MSIAVGIMAYNEADSVGAAVRSVFDQRGPHVTVDPLILVASGCTDGTIPAARAAAGGEPRFRVLEQPVREGKAAAVTAFLEAAGAAPILVLMGGDTVLEPGALEALIAPFDDPGIGMVGGRPVPVNSHTTLMGRVVHLLWDLHHAISLASPKLGELVACRPVFDRISADSAVDEAEIESLIEARGLRRAYAPGARVRMKGPTTVGDFLAQRRRIHAGHLALRRQTGYSVSTLSPFRGARAALGILATGGVGPLTLVVATTLEATARALGAWDARFGGRDHRVWERIASTKNLNP
jgi:poly-beta-1,6-N-acetyl-D-glucosamine synthase